MESEQVFLDTGHVKVTLSRLIVGSTTYAMNGITSVWQTNNLSEKSDIYVQMFIGLFLLLIPTILGLFKLLLYSERYSLMISTASGNEVAYTSSSQQEISKIIKAINEALVARK